MIYIDTSVALATLLNEKRQPPKHLWVSLSTSSQLLQYEVVVRMNALGRPPKAMSLARDLLQRIDFIDLDAPALARALQPFPVSVRTLDAIHLSTMDFLRTRGITLELATYDARLAKAATALGFALVKI